MPVTGPDWDGFVVRDEVIYPIGRKIQYAQPFLRAEMGTTFNEVDEYQKHMRGLTKSSKINIEDRGSYQVIEENEDTEDEMSPQKVSTILNKIQKMKSSGKKKGGLKDTDLVILGKNSDDGAYPLFPNEVTALSSQEINNGKYAMNYFSNHSEYIVYDDSLVRIKYILQLSKKSKAALAKGNLNC